MPDQTLNVVNFGQTTLAAALSNSATTAQFASTANMPLVPFIFQVDSELCEATTLNSGVYTITRNIEGSGAVAHAIGAAVNIVMTADMFASAYPNGSEVAQPGIALQMGRYDFHYAVTASASGTIAAPTNPIPFAKYTIVDVGDNFGTFPQNFNSGQASLGAGNQNGSSYSFIYLPTAQIWQPVL